MRLSLLNRHGLPGLAAALAVLLALVINVSASGQPFKDLGTYKIPRVHAKRPPPTGRSSW